MPYKNIEDRIKNSRNYYLQNKEDILRKVKKYYFSHWEYSQKKRNKWLKEHPLEASYYKKKYSQSKKGKIALKKSRQKYFNELSNKVKTFARFQVRRSLRIGTIVKSSNCEDCDKHGVRLEAHHYKGYNDSNALKIRWLCIKCHNKYKK